MLRLVIFHGLTQVNFCEITLIFSVLTRVLDKWWHFTKQFRLRVYSDSLLKLPQLLHTQSQLTHTVGQLVRHFVNFLAQVNGFFSYVGVYCLECFYTIAELFTVGSILHGNLPVRTNNIFYKFGESSFLKGVLLNLKVLSVSDSHELPHEFAGLEHLRPTNPREESII